MTESRASNAYASSPCMAHELDPAYLDPPEQAADVMRWRRAMRATLRGARATLGVAARQDLERALSEHLRMLIEERFDGARGQVLSAYWPIKGEPDLRPLMASLHRAGVTVVLPVVEQKSAPLTFRRWTPETKMIRGDWNIPVPPPEAERLSPDIMLAPVIGWTERGYRLGYGGGYFDRTLAVCDPRPATIGVGLTKARLTTIYPQPHDIPLDLIVTEAGVMADRGAQ
jgi:5,10-methenyltetrahydrofolate synthetase